MDGESRHLRQFLKGKYSIEWIIKSAINVLYYSLRGLDSSYALVPDRVLFRVLGMGVGIKVDYMQMCVAEEHKQGCHGGLFDL